MGILRKRPLAESPIEHVGSFNGDGSFSTEVGKPAALIGAIAEALAPDAALRVRAPASSWEFGMARPAAERYRIDDPQVREIKRLVIGIEDEHGTMHIAYVGNFASPYFFESIEKYPEAEKRLLENRRERQLEQEKYKRENPIACGVKHCGKRFKTVAGLRMHVVATVRREPGPGEWGEQHAKFWESRSHG